MSGVALLLSEVELEALIDKRVETKLAALALVKQKDVMNVREVAELLGKHPKTIRKLVIERGLPVLKTTGNEPRFMRAAVLSWLEGKDPT
jgi:excisionase family DNA binding protein